MTRSDPTKRGLPRRGEQGQRQLGFAAVRNACSQTWRPGWPVDSSSRYCGGVVERIREKVVFRIKKIHRPHNLNLN